MFDIVLIESSYRPHAYDVIISFHPHLGAIGLRLNPVVSDVPAADHKRVQGIGFYPQHGFRFKIV